MDEFGLSPEMQKLIRDTREVVPNVMEYVKTTGAEAEKVNIFMADLEEREVLRKELMAIPELSISSSMYNNLEVNAKGADKGSALLWLADYLGIDREETMSFGDGENDIPMIQAAGIGVAMENALDTVKAAADMITLKNDEDGVAAAIRKIIFGSNENDDGTLAINRSRCVLVGMMLYGHYRGLLRQCVSLGALVLTIITVKVATPYVTDFVKANPVIRENAAHFIMEVSGWQPPEESESILPAAQRMAIEELKLPQSVKDVLLENNNSEFYRLLGVDQFGEYISTCLSDMLINTLGSVLVFAASYIVIHLVIRWLNLLSRLPIICGLNQMAGGIVGLAEGFLLLWLAGFILSFLRRLQWGRCWKRR